MVSRNILRQLQQYAKSNDIKKVIVGLSGGADSVALLSLLLEAGISVKAFHCNFNLREDESLRDRDFVVDLCSRLKTPLEIKEFNTICIFNTCKGDSLENLCRRLRYDWFLTSLKEEGYDRIAVGHNADDQIETFFLNLCRGAGSRGLKGMKEDTGEIWRPLLCFSKKEIIEYVNRKGLDFVVDSSNLQSDFRRNYIRNKIIPLFREEWKGFDKSVLKSIKNLREENEVIEKKLNEILGKYGDSLPVAVIKDFGSPELLVRRFISGLHPYSTTAGEILKAVRAKLPKVPAWTLPGGKLLIRKGNLVRILI